MATQRYRTPDGSLELLVVREGGDITIGFDGYTWHTHADVLVGEYELIGESVGTPDQAVQRFLRDLQANVTPIVVLRKAGKIQDVWAALETPEEDAYLEADEAREVRYWSR
jgi:hypothetical protein